MRRNGAVWTTDKDGIVPALLSAEITARMGRDPGEVYRDLTNRLGNPVFRRHGFFAGRWPIKEMGLTAMDYTRVSCPEAEAILFRLQSDEWRRTSELLRGILADAAKPPPARLRALVHAFIRSECEEAAIRVALNDAAPLYRDAPEAQDARAAGEGIVAAFMREALPKASDATRILAGELITATLSEVGKSFSEETRGETEIAVYADAMADMFCAYLATLARR